MKQFGKCGSVRTDDIFNLHLVLVQAPESASPASCKTPLTFIDSLHPNNYKEKNNTGSRNEIQLPTNLSCCFSLHTQNQTAGLKPPDSDIF